MITKCHIGAPGPPLRPERTPGASPLSAARPRGMSPPYLRGGCGRRVGEMLNDACVVLMLCLAGVVLAVGLIGKAIVK